MLCSRLTSSGATRSFRARHGLALIALALCASALPAQGRVVVSLRGYEAPIMLDTVGSLVDVKAPIGRVYEAAIAAFEELGIPVNAKDPARGIVAATRFAKMHSLAGRAMSEFFSCGSGPTGPHADEWRLDIAVAALLEAGADGTTRLRLATVTSAQDVLGSARDPLPCSSTGRFETILLNLITRKSAGS